MSEPCDEYAHPREDELSQLVGDETFTDAEEIERLTAMVRELTAELAARQGNGCTGANACLPRLRRPIGRLADASGGPISWQT